MSVVLLVTLITAVAGGPSDDVFLLNTVTVPPNCPPGQEWYNEACRDVWGYMNMRSLVTVPPQCPPGQIWFNGLCRELWTMRAGVGKSAISAKEDMNFKGVVKVPDLECPEGYGLDALGQCRPKI